MVGRISHNSSNTIFSTLKLSYAFDNQLNINILYLLNVSYDFLCKWKMKMIIKVRPKPLAVNTINVQCATFNSPMEIPYGFFRPCTNFLPNPILDPNMTMCL